MNTLNEFILLSHKPVNALLQGLYIGGSLDASRGGFSGTINSGLLVQVLAIITVYIIDFMTCYSYLWSFSDGCFL